MMNVRFPSMSYLSSLLCIAGPRAKVGPSDELPEARPIERMDRPMNPLLASCHAGMRVAKYAWPALLTSSCETTNWIRFGAAGVIIATLGGVAVWLALRNRAYRRKVHEQIRLDDGGAVALGFLQAYSMQAKIVTEIKQALPVEPIEVKPIRDQFIVSIDLELKTLLAGFDRALVEFMDSPLDRHEALRECKTQAMEALQTFMDARHRLGMESIQILLDIALGQESTEQAEKLRGWVTNDPDEMLAALNEIWLRTKPRSDGENN